MTSLEAHISKLKQDAVLSELVSPLLEFIDLQFEHLKAQTEQLKAQSAEIASLKSEVAILKEQLNRNRPVNYPLLFRQICGSSSSICLCGCVRNRRLYLATSNDTTQVHFLY